jgi:hypothetical protein
MEKNVFEHVKKYNESKNYSIDEPSLIETIRECGKPLWQGNPSKHRWWTEYTNVVVLNGMIIGYRDGESSGDEDAGYEFNPASIHEYEPKEVTKTIYVKKQVDLPNEM